jgi:hypothetical protein
MLSRGLKLLGIGGCDWLLLAGGNRHLNLRDDVLSFHHNRQFDAAEETLCHEQHSGRHRTARYSLQDCIPYVWVNL